jgi:hypothetical protein
MNPKHELKCIEMAGLAERFLPLTDFGFRKSEVLTERDAIVIYDSGKCRIKLSWEGWDMYTGDTVMIYYGRSHAISDRSTMIWNGEECYCWNHPYKFLDFLDGLTPLEASKNTFPRFVDELSKSGTSNKYSTQCEGQLSMNAAVWQQYGQRLFDLFDLLQPDLWNQYSDFLVKYYSLKGSGIIPINPPLYKVC